METHDAFISYARADQDFVHSLANKLSKRNISVFFDKTALATGDTLVHSINQAVESAKYVIAVMSPDYFASTWARKEYELALVKEFKNEKVKVLPILYRDCDIASQNRGFFKRIWNPNWFRNRENNREVSISQWDSEPLDIPSYLANREHWDFRTDKAIKDSFPKLLEILSKEPQVLVEPLEQSESTVRAVDRVPSSGLESASDSISRSDLNHDELIGMFEDLQKKVEVFTGQAGVLTNTVDDSSVEVDPKLCFVAMPFGSKELNEIYEYYIKPAIKDECGLKCERGDDAFGSNEIMEDILSSIQRAKIIVADLTDRNPNVFYEVGIAHTLKKDVFLLCQSMQDVPFDLRHRRVLVYDKTPKGYKELEKRVAKNVSKILNGET